MLVTVCEYGVLQAFLGRSANYHVVQDKKRQGLPKIGSSVFDCAGHQQHGTLLRVRVFASATPALQVLHRFMQIPRPGSARTLS